MNNLFLDAVVSRDPGIPRCVSQIMSSNSFNFQAYHIWLGGVIWAQTCSLQILSATAPSKLLHACYAFTSQQVNILNNFILKNVKASSQAPRYASPKLSATESLTGVKCRATSVANNYIDHPRTICLMNSAQLVGMGHMKIIQQKNLVKVKTNISQWRGNLKAKVMFARACFFQKSSNWFLENY